MKGLAVLAIGAILIWFGLSRQVGGDGEAFAGDGGEFEAAETGMEPGSESADADEALQRLANLRREVIPQEDPFASEAQEASFGHGAPGDLETDSPSVPGGAVPAAYSDPVPEPVVEAIVEPAPQPARAAPQERGPLLLSGGNGPDTERVAVFLLEAYLAEDHSDLQTYLTQGEGAGLPVAQRMLVASFWQALGGHLEQAREGQSQISGAEGITSAQEGLLSAAIADPGKRAVPRSASSGRIEPLGYAMRMVLLADEAKELLRDREYARSAMAWSDLIQDELRAPWSPHREALLAWGKNLDRAQVNHRFNVNGHWPSIEEKIQSGGSLIRLRKRVLKRRSDLVLCTGLIAQVNGVTGYVQPGQVMRIPTDRVNVIVDLDARMILYRHGEEVVRLWDIGVGKPGHETPIGVYEVGHKIEKPAHTTKGLPYGDPENPLGSRWMGLRRPGQDRDTSYGIHGTSAPGGVGGAVSLGCVRMRNEDVNELFEILPRGAEVVIQP